MSVLATGAATGSWSEEGGKPVKVLTGSVERTQREAAAGDAEANSAGEVVSRSGDRWSAAYSAREYEDVERTLEGKYVGTGLWVKTDERGRMEVARVRSGSPAGEADVRPGDRLLSVDGEAVDAHPVTEVVAMLRGSTGERARPGSTVVLGLRRGGHTWTVPLRRAELKAETVTVQQDREEPEGTAVIRVESFTEGSGDQVRRAAADARGSEGILLDLRGNSGGLLVEAVGAASAFVDAGVVATYDLHGSQQALYAEPGGNTETPLVVLVDSDTMSAAELLAGALQDRGRAVVVGSRTFGKGSVQLPSEQPDGSVAKLTVGEYRTPAGRSLERRGVAPDLRVPPGRDAEAEARTVLSGLGRGA